MSLSIQWQLWESLVSAIGDTWLHAAPIFHLADAWSIFAITWVGGKHVFMPHFTAAEALRIMSQEKVTTMVLVPTMLNANVERSNSGRL